MTGRSTRLETILARLTQRPAQAAIALAALVSLGGCALGAPVPPTPAAPGAVALATVSATLPAGEPSLVATVAVAAEITPTTAPTVTPTAVSLAARLPTPTPPPPMPTPETTATPTATPAWQPTPDGQVRTERIPILMYHYLSTPPADADIYRQDLSVAPDLFAAHLDRLLAEGYSTISPYQLLAHLVQGAPLPPKPVLITFDDGYRDNYTNAFPALKERGMQATFFVISDFLDEERPDYLSWDMAREMLAAGMPIESHSRNHFTLEGQDTDYLVWQALGSLETIQFELGVRPRFISYPAGDYDQNTIEVFKSANYWGGLTTEQGTTQSSEQPFEFERVRVRNTTTPDQLIRLMTADW